MLDGIMANNAVGLAFGGGLQDAKKQGECLMRCCAVLSSRVCLSTDMHDRILLLPC